MWANLHFTTVTQHRHCYIGPSCHTQVYTVCDVQAKTTPESHCINKDITNGDYYRIYTFHINAHISSILGCILWFYWESDLNLAAMHLVTICLHSQLQ